ncbi:unnamed protein product, partial [Notodromas monacha]
FRFVSSENSWTRVEIVSESGIVVTETKISTSSTRIQLFVHRLIQRLTSKSNSTSAKAASKSFFLKCKKGSPKNYGRSARQEAKQSGTGFEYFTGASRTHTGNGKTSFLLGVKLFPGSPPQAGNSEFFLELRTLPLETPRRTRDPFMASVGDNCHHNTRKEKEAVDQKNYK